MDIKLANDIEIKNGDLVTVADASATAQRIRHRLLTFRGEWFLDLDFGPNYRADMLIKNPRLDIITAIMKAEILKSVDEGSFDDFEAGISADRKLTIRYTLNLIGEKITDTVII